MYCNGKYYCVDYTNLLPGKYEFENEVSLGKKKSLSNCPMEYDSDAEFVSKDEFLMFPNSYTTLKISNKVRKGACSKLMEMTTSSSSSRLASNLVDEELLTLTVGAISKVEEYTFNITDKAWHYPEKYDQMLEIGIATKGLFGFGQDAPSLTTY